MTKPWFLYMIECVDGSIYTGIAVDVEGRYAAHCQGTGARYTRSHPPFRLLGYENHPDRSSASKAEYRIKQLSPGEKRRYAASLVQAPAEIPDPESVTRCLP
ncbi:GIY-YIG nuclease family protein [Ferribacterium limneticum]|uniref:GIY-YIG nuclease family protein n=1 Tax=Ferribacterium limneticum TaxID=76259 RepID=UPI001CF912CD|nr:GIY-YIG nuclease family protein [Ferribacterium limneticum]UCV24640.1 GIY-YIG nuclease family protein [Ferribacterium limneticum]